MILDALKMRKKKEKESELPESIFHAVIIKSYKLLTNYSPKEIIEAKYLISQLSTEAYKLCFLILETKDGELSRYHIFSPCIRVNDIRLTIKIPHESFYTTDRHRVYVNGKNILTAKEEKIIACIFKSMLKLKENECLIKDEQEKESLRNKIRNQ